MRQNSHLGPLPWGLAILALTSILLSLLNSSLTLCKIDTDQGVTEVDPRLLSVHVKQQFPAGMVPVLS